YHYGAMTAHQTLFFTGILVAVMSALTVVRHTREEESTGRSELVLSAPVGRHAPLVAALLTALAANAAVGLALVLSLGSVSAEGIDWSGAWLYGAAHVAVGMSFAGLAAVAAQLYESARGAVGASLAAVGLAYLVRAVGDVAGNGLAWLSPLGWRVHRADDGHRRPPELAAGHGRGAVGSEAGQEPRGPSAADARGLRVAPAPRRRPRVVGREPRHGRDVRSVPRRHRVDAGRVRRLRADVRERRVPGPGRRVRRRDRGRHGRDRRGVRGAGRLAAALRGARGTSRACALHRP